MLGKLFQLINRSQKQSALITLDSGFLTLPGTGINDLFTDELIVLVHPYHPAAYVNNKDNPAYENRRDELARSCISPILIGVEDMRLPVSTKWLEELRPVGPRIIYKTDYVNSRPTQPSEHDFVERVKTTFNPSKIRLGGAELYIKDDGKLANGGCVNGTYRLLSPHFEVTLDRGYCWNG
jgi:hypothetical protein